VAAYYKRKGQHVILDDDLSGEVRVNGKTYILKIDNTLGTGELRAEFTSKTRARTVRQELAATFMAADQP
jgi:hypothetical protein